MLTILLKFLFLFARKKFLRFPLEWFLLEPIIHFVTDFLATNMWQRQGKESKNNVNLHVTWHVQFYLNTMCFAYLCWLCDLSLYLRTFYFSLELLEMQHWPSSKVISGQWMWWRSRSVFVMIETGNIIMPSSLPRRHFQRSSFFIPPLKHLLNRRQHSFPKLSQSHYFNFPNSGKLTLTSG